MEWPAQFSRVVPRHPGKPSAVPIGASHGGAFPRRNPHLALRTSRKVLRYCLIRTED